MPTLYDHGSPPPGAQFLDGSPGIIRAHTVDFDEPGQITELWFYCGTQTGGTWTLNLWEVTTGDASNLGAGTPLASKVFTGTPVGSAWNKVVLDPPISVTDVGRYRHGVHNGQYYWAGNGHFNAHDDSANGINARRSGDSSSPLGVINQGTFGINSVATTYPRSTGTQANYGVDITFVPDEETPPEEHTSTGTARATATATAADSTTRTSAGTLTALAAATSAETTSRTTTGRAAALALAAAVTTTSRTSAGTASAAVSARATDSTTRTSAGTARAVAAGGSYIAQGAPGPWITTRSGDTRIVTRVQVAN